jgi:TetR/AcrR family transcriptional repressor of nem operon
MARPTGRDLRTELIQEATTAIQTNGTSFSFQQLAEQLGVRAPSLHHHFRRKSDLIDAAASQYIEAFEDAVAKLDHTNAVDRLAAYVDVFTAPSREGRFCLCGALTADWQDTSPAMQKRIRAFFAGQHIWVQRTVEQGQAAGELQRDLDPDAFASGFIAALEGALLLARVVPNRAASDGPLEMLRLARA